MTSVLHIVPGGFEGLGPALRQVSRPGRVAVVTNPVVGALYREAVHQSLTAAGFAPRWLEIPDGEAHKTVETWHRLVEDLLAGGLDRRTPVLALGGGVTGDIVGFAAATALRGVPVVQVPTTLLAMVDSAIGGKTGVNSAGGKNLIGAFHTPILVYAAVSALQTLDDAELRCGLGEVVKHGLLGDPQLFALCEREAARILARDPAVLCALVERSVAVKSAVVAEDATEQGLRVILNLGHTVAHALEATLGFGALRHGEAVAIGLLAEARWAVARGAAAPELVTRLEALLRALELPTALGGGEGEAGASGTATRLLAAAGVDKKVVDGTLKTPILNGIGTVQVISIPTAELTEIFTHLTERSED